MAFSFFALPPLIRPSRLPQFASPDSFTTLPPSFGAVRGQLVAGQLDQRARYTPAAAFTWRN